MESKDDRDEHGHASVEGMGRLSDDSTERHRMGGRRVRARLDRMAQSQGAERSDPSLSRGLPVAAMVTRREFVRLGALASASPIVPALDLAALVPPPTYLKVVI